MSRLSLLRKDGDEKPLSRSERQRWRYVGAKAKLLGRELDGNGADAKRGDSLTDGVMP